MKELEEIIKDLESDSFKEEEGANVVLVQWAIDAVKTAYTLGRNKTADWIYDKCEDKFMDEEGDVVNAVAAYKVSESKTTKDLDV